MIEREKMTGQEKGRIKEREDRDNKNILNRLNTLESFFPNLFSKLEKWGRKIQ